MPNETFHFPPFRLLPGVGLLFREGAPVSLEPRAVKVLAYLVRSRNRVVPKEELLDKVWSDVFTTDAVLKQAVSQVRRALGDSADAPRYIQTFHARGYQFIAPVSVEWDEAGAAMNFAGPAEADEKGATTQTGAGAQDPHESGTPE